MAEPTTLEEAYEGYKANKFSRKDLWGFMIDRLKATEARVAAVEEQNRQLVTALVRSVADAPMPPLDPLFVPGWGKAEEWHDINVATAKLQAQAEGLGIKVDRRWSTSTLKAKIEAVLGLREAAHG